MVNFGPLDSVPEKYRQRRLYIHNANVTLMRTTPAECAELGRITAEKLNRARGPVVFLMPLRGVSAIDSAGLPFSWPEADRSYIDALKANLDRAFGWPKLTRISTTRPSLEMLPIVCWNCWSSRRVETLRPCDSARSSLTSSKRSTKGRRVEVRSGTHVMIYIRARRKYFRARRVFPSPGIASQVYWNQQATNGSNKANHSRRAGQKTTAR